MTTPGLPTSRVAFIGAGHVGATAAYATMLRALFEEIVLIDHNQALAASEAIDLAHANALARPARIWAGDYGDAAGAQVAILTAGAASKGSESRLALAARSAAIVGDCAQQLKEAGFAGILIVASNPVDLMTVVATRHSGLDAGRVIGTGTLLDSARLKHRLSADLSVAPGAIDGYVLGEHGDSEVAAFSTVRIGGLSLAEFTGADGEIDKHAIADEVRCGGYRVIEGKGYTSFGIATAIVRITEAVLRDEHAVLPVSSLVENAYGMDAVCLSLPAVISGSGIERVLLPDLDNAEQDALRASAATLRAALATLDTPSGPQDTAPTGPPKGKGHFTAFHSASEEVNSARQRAAAQTKE